MIFLKNYLSFLDFGYVM